MKKLLTFSLCFVLIFFCGCKKTPKQYTSNEASSVTVYITKTGSKYHTKKCYHLKKSCKEIYLDEAVEKGYEPCLNCVPPEIE